MVVCVLTPAPLAVMVIAVVPAVAVVPALSVRTLEVLDASRLAGAKLPVTPAGSPLSDSDTAPVKLPPRAMVSVTVPVPATFMLTDGVGALRVSVPG